MKFHVEKIEICKYANNYRVVDENGLQYGEDYPVEIHATWAAEDLNAGKKQLTDDEAFDLALEITGEVEMHRETGSPISIPADAEKVIPVREDRDEVTISGQNEVGTIVEYRGESWLVTHCYEVTGREYTHDEDEDQPAGWYSELFRVRDNSKAMESVAEQYATGQARFTGPTTVKFADEDIVHDLRDLTYSPESGLYDKKHS